MISYNKKKHPRKSLWKVILKIKKIRDKVDSKGQYGRWKLRVMGSCRKSLLRWIPLLKTAAPLLFANKSTVKHGTYLKSSRLWYTFFRALWNTSILSLLFAINCQGKAGRALYFAFCWQVPGSNHASNFKIGQVITRVIAKSDERGARGRFEITSMITPWIVRHEVLLLINRIYNKFRN